jgi:hypothetical protein
MRRAMFLVRTHAEPGPEDMPETREEYDGIKPIWDQWRAMERGGNEDAPLQKSYTGNRDWDINLDGIAHIGMFPDFFQDVYNQLHHHQPSDAKVKDLSALFRGASDYIVMWEKIEAGRRR